MKNVSVRSRRCLLLGAAHMLRSLIRKLSCLMGGHLSGERLGGTERAQVVN